MAKGGGRGRRSYVRDARGRFASTPGGGAAKKAKPQGSFRTRQAASLARQRGQAGFAGSATRKAKRQLKASAKRLKANASPQQKAAVTRARNKVRSLSPIRRMATTGRRGVVAKPKGLKPGALSTKAKAAPRAQFDLAAWQRRAARVKSIGIRRANIESGANDFEKELRKVQRAYATQVSAERFLKELTQDRRDPTGKTLVRGGDALRANFDARPRRTTASTPRGVAARNRIYDQERKDKRAANKAAREVKAAAKKATVKPVAKTLRVIRIPKQANRIGFPRLSRETAKALQPFLRDLPTVPTRRKPDYVQSGPGGNLKTFYLSNEQPRRATAKQIASIKKAMSGWAHQSSGLGHRQTYSRVFYGMGGSNESVRVTITRKGGPLVGGQVEVTRSVTSKGGRRGGGSLAERAAGLPRKPRISSVPRRRRKPAP